MHTFLCIVRYNSYAMHTFLYIVRYSSYAIHSFLWSPIFFFFSGHFLPWTVDIPGVLDSSSPSSHLFASEQSFPSKEQLPTSHLVTGRSTTVWCWSQDMERPNRLCWLNALLGPPIIPVFTKRNVLPVGFQEPDRKKPARRTGPGHDLSPLTPPSGTDRSIKILSGRL
uniref:Uncharacterized protein n=1 Tax=Timema cristinae TaxID=61476 RepID=A0A7R9DB45_TIMCR|nr:unnamed protein product [Timema cristinae]